MKAWRVDQRLNNVKNNDVSLTEPLKDDDPRGFAAAFATYQEMVARDGDVLQV
jgi:hypothetical protein